MVKDSKKPYQFAACDRTLKHQMGISLLFCLNVSQCRVLHSYHTIISQNFNCNFTDTLGKYLPYLHQKSCKSTLNPVGVEIVKICWRWRWYSTFCRCLHHSCADIQFDFLSMEIVEVVEVLFFWWISSFKKKRARGTRQKLQNSDSRNQKHRMKNEI